MSASSAPMLAALTLTPVEPQVFDRAFEATPQPCPWPKAYGGDMVAQAALAAMLTVQDKELHSLHSYFLRPVDMGVPVRYEVELLRDGRGYATRQVRGFQHDKVVYATLASFAAPAGDLDVQPATLPGIPAPETLPSSEQYLAGVELPAEVHAYWSTGRSFDMRHVPSPVYVSVEGRDVAHQGVWVRAFEALPDDPTLQRAALTYVCDYTIIEPTLRALGVSWSHPGLMTASLDHAMWLHREARADEWLFYAQEMVSAHDQRGLGVGRFFDRDGRLVATVAQEALIRLPDAPKESE